MRAQMQALAVQAKKGREEKVVMKQQLPEVQVQLDSAERDAWRANVTPNRLKTRPEPPSESTNVNRQSDAALSTGSGLESLARLS